MSSQRSTLKNERKNRKQQAKQSDEAKYVFGDENFAFIAGYTSGGAAYGLSYEEWDLIEDTDDEIAAAEKQDKSNRWEVRKKNYTIRSSKWESKRLGYSSRQY